MATFIPGVTDIFPETVGYTVPWNIFQNGLAQRQGRYEQGKAASMQRYNALTNAALSNNDNLSLRDNFMKQAEQEMSKITSSDLSIQANVDAANNVFKPLIEDREFIHDMTTTKIGQSEIERGLSLKYSKNKEDQESYWDTGVEYVQNSLRDLANAKRGDGSIMQVSARKYVPFRNVQKYLDDEAAAEKLEMVVEHLDGGYKMIIKNGDGSKRLYQEWAQQKIANQPQFNDYFKVLGVVEYENKLNKFISAGYDKQAAAALIAPSYLQEQSNYYSQLSTQLSSQRSELVTTATSLKKRVMESPSLEDMQSLEQVLTSLDNLDKNINAYESNAKEYSDPNSRKYQETFNAIKNGGESFFAENNRSNFITRWGLGRAANTSITYGVNAAYQFEQTLAIDKDNLEARWAEINNKALTGKKTGTSNADGTPLTQEQLNDIPQVVGDNIYGSSTKDTYNILMGLQKRYHDRSEGYQFNFIKDGIKNLGGNDNLFGALNNTAVLDYLQGNDNKLGAKEFYKIVSENELLKKLNWKNGPYKDLKSEAMDNANIIFNHMYEQAQSDFKKGVANAGTIKMLDNLEESKRAYKKYQILDQRIKNIKVNNISVDQFTNPNDPRYDKFLTEVIKYGEAATTTNGATKPSKEKYTELKSQDVEADLKSGKLLFVKGITGSLDTFITTPSALQSKYRTVDGSPINTKGETKIINPQGGLSSIKVYDASELKSAYGYDSRVKAWAAKDFSNFEKNYNSYHTVIEKQFNELNFKELGFLGKTIHFDIDGKGADEIKVQELTRLALGNIANQDVAKGGIILPQNYKKLQDKNVTDDELTIISNSLRNPEWGNIVNGADLSSFGSNGNTTLTVKLKNSWLDGLVSNKSISKESAAALAEGLEFDLTGLKHSLLTDSVVNPGINELEKLIYGNHETVSAPKIWKELGYDYNIATHDGGKTLTITGTYPDAATGKSSALNIDPISLGNYTIEEVRALIQEKFISLYLRNSQILSQQRTQTSLTDTERKKLIDKANSYKIK